MLLKNENWTDSGYVYVNWWVNNICNFDCSYCHPTLKHGKGPWPELSKLKNLIENIASHYNNSNRKPYFQFVGGEFTFYEQFTELMQWVRNTKGLTELHTNGSKDLLFWEQNVKYLDSVILNYHPEYTNREHFMNVARLIKEHTKIHININMMADKWDELVLLETELQNMGFSVSKKITFQNPIQNTKPVEYEEPAKQHFVEETGPFALTVDGQTKNLSYNSLVMNNKNQFQGWYCSAGMEQLIIDVSGNIFRGHCRVGGKIGNIMDDHFEFPKEPIQCPRLICANGFDVHASKAVNKDLL